jgi:UDP-2-acetamido-3-amino-2,3-dideoxy-glucuronate N-acetyltransferase
MDAGPEPGAMLFDAGMASSDPAVATEEAPRIVRLPRFADARGGLIAAEVGSSVPFPVMRCFVVRDVPPGATRARHAQRHGHELLCCVAGACAVEVRWSAGEAVHRLGDPATALYLPPRVWVECREFTGDAVLMVLCSHRYDPEDVIADLGQLGAEPGEPGS